MATEICAGGFLMRKNKFLFGKRSRKKSWAPGLWDIVGGRSKKNESPFETLKRETFEEIGIIVLHAQHLAEISVPEKEANTFFTYHIYMITSWKGKPVNRSDEHTKLRWMTREKLGKIQIALKEYLPMIDSWLDESKSLSKMQEPGADNWPSA
jgi:8-oxo-dGTP pyrophosphatase MutT (NUDIX family)